MREKILAADRCDQLARIGVRRLCQLIHRFRYLTPDGVKRGMGVSLKLAESALTVLIDRAFGLMAIGLPAQISIEELARSDVPASSPAIATTAIAERTPLRPDIASPRRARQLKLKATANALPRLKPMPMCGIIARRLIAKGLRY